jgi:hypothetical protein
MAITVTEARLHQILLIGTFPDGVMADASSEMSLAIGRACEELVNLGLMTRGKPINNIRVYHSTIAGARQAGVAVH